jgi:hypothetical protein
MTPRELAKANLENLYRIFTVPEAPDSTLGQIDQAIADNVTGFLQEHIVALERSLEEIEGDFNDSRIPEEPTFVSEYTEFVKEKLVAQSVHTAAPGFVGHMTSALPYFMLPLSRIMTALNQNLVKVETSKAFTPMERQVLAMLHRLVYAGDDEFYQRWIHNSEHALGAFCSGGTIANVTALWTARNRLCAPDGEFKGIAREGLVRALQHLDCRGLAVLVSQRGHYSLGKAVDLLGIGRDNLVRIETDDHNRINLAELRRECRRLQDDGIRPLALVGIAGTTETGSIDPLNALADLAAEIGCHFHVDAAWGGPTLFSSSHRHLLDGIQLRRRGEGPDVRLESFDGQIPLPGSVDRVDTVPHLCRRHVRWRWCGRGRRSRRGRIGSGRIARRGQGDDRGRRWHRGDGLPQRLQLLRHRRQADVGFVGLLAQDATGFGHPLHEQLLVGERFLCPRGVGVQPAIEGLQRVAETEEHGTKLLLFLLQHPDLGHQQLVLLVGTGARRARHQEANGKDSSRNRS